MGRDAWRVGALGVNAWLVWAVLPVVLAEPRWSAALTGLFLPVVPLIGGTAVLRTWPRVAAWLLLGAFPLGLALAATGADAVTARAPYSTVGLVIGVLVVAAYGAAALAATTRPTSLRPTVAHPLDGFAAPRTPRVRRVLRRGLLGVSTVAALGLAVIAPGADDHHGYEQHWGHAASEGATLTTVVGACLAAASIGLFIAPTFRASRLSPPSRRQVYSRAVGFLVAAAIGFGAFLLYAK